MHILFDRLTALVAIGLTLSPFQLLFASDLGFDAVLSVSGGAHRMFRQGVDHPALEIGAWSLNGSSHDLKVSFHVEDFFGRPAPESIPSIIMHLSGDGSKTTIAVPLDLGIGYYAIKAECSDDAGVLDRLTDLGVVWARYSGPRPDSLFASKVNLRQGEDLQFLETIGLKVQRTHFYPQVPARGENGPAERPAYQAAPINFERLDKVWKETQAHGLWVLPIVGYSLGGAAVFDRTPLAEKLGMYGPPNDEERFIRTWEQVLRHYPELTTLEFWNEPWIFGWTWAATAEDYRRFQKDWCSMALRVNPHYRILAGNSAPFVRDILEPFPDSWEGLISGVTHHPYVHSVVGSTFGTGDVFRSSDEIGLAARDLGLRYAYLTEGGTVYSRPKSKDDTEPYNNIENAEKLVQYYVGAALAGVYMANAQWQIGYRPGWTHSNTAFAVMTHFLEDRVPLVDQWPRQELLRGAIFAHPRFARPAVRALPRANELSARWEVAVPPERRDDNTKVAVLWGLTGSSRSHLDQNGELVVLDPADLKAFNIVGQEILPVDGKLVVPLTSSPVYITTDRLSVLELRDRIALGVIRHITPVNLYAFSLLQRADEEQNLSVRIESQLNRRLRGTPVLRVPGTDQTSSARFDIGPGDLAEVQIPWPKVPASADNRYPITITAYFDNDFNDLGEAFLPVSRDQVVSVAFFKKQSVRLTGELTDWNGLTPVTIESDWFHRPDDQTERLLNPGVEPKPGEAETKRITGRIFTAYDDDFVYVGAAINEAAFHCSAGEPFVRKVGSSTVSLSYKQGEPDGLIFITECGDVFQFGFGFRERVPGAGRQIDDPWAWKGSFYDTDYSFVANASADGDRLTRIWGPDTSRRNGYQTDAAPEIGAVPGAQVKITRNENSRLTLYEVAIPRRQLALFDPAARRCRFGFIIYNGQKIAGGALGWSDVAGVFDYWQSCGSYPPTWKSHSACQTFFGIEP